LEQAGARVVTPEMLKAFELGEGDFSAEKLDINAEFIFPSKKEDFKIRIFKKEGVLFAELPDDLGYHNDGKLLDFQDGSYMEYPGKIWAIYC